MDFRLIAMVVTGIAALIGGAYVVSKLWKDIRQKVSAWLRDRGLQKSALMDAWVVFDQLVSTIKCKIFVKTKQSGKQLVTEEIFTKEELRQADPKVYAEMQKNSSVEKHIMDLLQS